MASYIKTVGVCGTGVIGASWTGLFLAKGMRVLVSDPAPGADEKLDAHLHEMWPVLQRIGLGSGASLSNYQFVGASLDEHLGEVDFVQEVLHCPLDFYAGVEYTCRMHRSTSSSSAISSPPWMPRLAATSSLPPPRRDYPPPSLSRVARKTQPGY